MSDNPKITAKDIEGALLRVHSGDQWCVGFEVRNTTGATHNVRSADCIAMNVWPSQGFVRHAYEIKVSKTDLKKELSDPSKSEAISKFCHFFWLITPPGLTNEAEIPLTWGLKEVNAAGAIKTVKPAVKRDPVAVTNGFFASFVRNAGKPSSKMIEHAAEQRLEDQRKAHEAEIKRLKENFESNGTMPREDFKALTDLRRWRREMSDVFELDSSHRFASPVMYARQAKFMMNVRHAGEPITVAKAALLVAKAAGNLKPTLEALKLQPIAKEC